jgi:DNA-binding transcriptional ArsR family regulator
MADIFDVVADPTRRDLLQILLQRYVEGVGAPHGGESSVGELVQRLGLSQPTVSKHLKVLRESALVTVRDQGQHRYYKLDLAPLRALEDWLVPFLTADLPQDDVALLEPTPVLVLPERLRGVARSIGAAGATALYSVQKVVRPAGRSKPVLDRVT